MPYSARCPSPAPVLGVPSPVPCSRCPSPGLRLYLSPGLRLTSVQSWLTLPTVLAPDTDSPGSRHRQSRPAVSDGVDRHPDVEVLATFATFATFTLLLILAKAPWHEKRHGPNRVVDQERMTAAENNARCWWMWRRPCRIPLSWPGVCTHVSSPDHDVHEHGAAVCVPVYTARRA